MHIIDNMFQPEQRTKAWYEYRHNLITASSAGKVLKRNHHKTNLFLKNVNQCKIEKICLLIQIVHYIRGKNMSLYSLVYMNIYIILLLKIMDAYNTLFINF